MRPRPCVTKRRPGSTFRGVLLLHRPGGRVPRVGEGLLAGGFLGRVGRLEGVVRQEDLAADLQHRRRVAREHQRDRRDPPGVVRHVVAAGAVAAGDGPNEAAALVDERERHPVDLGLEEQRRLVVLARLGQPPPHAVGPGLQLGLVVGVVDAAHRHRVLHSLEARDGLAPHAVRGRVGVVQLRVLLLKSGQLPEQRVERGVGDLRPRLHVVEPVVPPERPRGVPRHARRPLHPIAVSVRSFGGSHTPFAGHR